MPNRPGHPRSEYADKRSVLRRLVAILGKAHRVFDAVVYRQRQQTQAINEMNSRLARIESLLSAPPMFPEPGRVAQSGLERPSVEGDVTGSNPVSVANSVIIRSDGEIECGDCGWLLCGFATAIHCAKCGGFIKPPPDPMLERDPLFERIEQLEQQISHRMREG